MNTPNYPELDPDLVAAENNWECVEELKIEPELMKQLLTETFKLKETPQLEETFIGKILIFFSYFFLILTIH